MALSEKNTTSMPWKNGYYVSRATPSILFLIEGEILYSHPAAGRPTYLKDNPMLTGSIKPGDFGELHPDVAKDSKQSSSNLEVTMFGGKFKSPGFVSNDGTKIMIYSYAHSADVLEWKNDEEIAKYKDSGDPVDAATHPYKVQPENQGKLLWISGAPGVGKSTSGLLLGRNEGYVFYEADCLFTHINPYVPTDVEEPSMALFAQKFLKGVPQKRIDTIAEGTLYFLSMGDENMYNYEKLCDFYGVIAEDVSKEHARIGGNFAVTQAVPTRELRDHIRTILGENLIFVVLHMSREDQIRRIKARHGEGKTADSVLEMLTKLYNIYETAAEDEPNSINVTVTSEMSPEDVVKEIVRLVK